MGAEVSVTTRTCIPFHSWEETPEVLNLIAHPLSPNTGETHSSVALMTVCQEGGGGVLPLLL